MKIERVRVGDVLRAERKSVVPDPTAEYVAIGVRSFGNGIFHYEPKLGDELGRLRFFDVQPGRLVVSNIKGWEGAIAVAGDADADCVASNRFLQYAPRDGQIDVRWAHWYFLSEPGIRLIQHASPGSADRNRTLAIDRFEALEIPLPPFDEQRRVGARLDRIASRSELVMNRRSLSSDLARALPLAVRADAERDVSMTPTRLGDVLQLVRSPVEIDPAAPYVSIGIRSFGRGLFHYPTRPGSEIGKLRFHGVTPRLLAISNIKGWEGTVATTEESEAGTVASNRFLLFDPIAGKDAVDYFWALLLASEGLGALGQASPGSADRNRTLAVERFSEITLDLPELAQQAAIGRRVRCARRAVSGFEGRVELSEQRASALLPAALNEAFASLR